MRCHFKKFILDTAVSPPYWAIDRDNTNIVFSAWQRQDQFQLSWLLSTLTKSILALVVSLLSTISV